MNGNPNPGNTPFDPTALPREYRAFEQLEAKITELWGHLNAATYRFLALIAEFDRNACYERHGLVNTAQWLNWQCGIGTVAAREKVRVSRALEQLPEISASFARGELSYSKVRAMTRVATPANESVLLTVGLHGTAAHVEKLVRKYRWTERRDAGQLAHAQYLERSLDYFYDHSGMLILHGRLPAEIGAVVRKALDAAVEELRESARGDVSAETSGRGEAESAAGQRADALLLLAERSLEHRGDDSGGTADRYQVVVHVDHAVLTQAVVVDECEPHCCELDEGPALALATARRLGCDATLVGIVDGADGAPLDIGRKTRAIPPALARALRSRDGGCRFPGCTRTRFTEGHHVRHWADGGDTKLGNLVTLCRFHHRLVHEGEFGLATTDDGVFVFTWPDGRRIAEHGGESFRGNIPLARPVPAADVSFEEVLRIHMLNREAGLHIDGETSRCRWLGEPMDYSQAIEGMQFLRDRAAAGA
jgi:hypothetical protein